MTQADHYRDQSNRARRLAQAIRTRKPRRSWSRWPRSSASTPSGSNRRTTPSGRAIA